MIDKFFSKVELDIENGCWNWIGSLDKDGYGIFNYLLGCRAYKFSYDYFVRIRPPNLLIDHLCDNKKCVNPTHLDAVTNRVNTLRGKSIQALNAAKTHCKRGHEFTKDNTYIQKNGTRCCRTCQRIHMRHYDKFVRVRNRRLAYG